MLLQAAKMECGTPHPRDRDMGYRNAARPNAHAKKSRGARAALEKNGTWSLVWLSQLQEAREAGVFKRSTRHHSAGCRGPPAADCSHDCATTVDRNAIVPMATAADQAGTEERIPPDEVLPGSLHCKLCGVYACWGTPGGPSRSVSSEFVDSWWKSREDAAERRGLSGHVVCTTCE